MPTTIQSVRLENTTGSHNKFYEIWIDRESGLYTVMFQYGRIGTSGVGGVKESGLTLASAQAVMADLRYSKQNKGYKKVSETANAAPLKKPLLVVKEGKMEVSSEYLPKKKTKAKKKAKKKKGDDKPPPRRSILV